MRKFNCGNFKITAVDYLSAFRYAYGHCNSGENFAIISIQEPGEKCFEYKVGGKCKAALNISFEDVTPSIKGSKHMMNDEDALKIKEFVEGLEDKDIDLLIVHCNAGVSRSGAVVAALAFVFTGSDKEVFDSGLYVPNMYVYYKILEAFGYSNNYQEEKHSEEKLYTVVLKDI